MEFLNKLVAFPVVSMKFVCFADKSPVEREKIRTQHKIRPVVVVFQILKSKCIHGFDLINKCMIMFHASSSSVYQLLLQCSIHISLTLNSMV